MLEFLDFFSKPSPYSTISLTSSITKNFGYDSLPTHQPFIRLLIKHGLLNLRPQMSILMHAEALGHLVFRKEFVSRYSKLTLGQKIRYKLRPSILVTNYSSFLRYINGLDDEQFDRRVVVQTKYGIRNERFSGDKYPLKVLDSFASTVKESKLPQYSNFSYKFKDNLDNLKEKQ